MLKGCTMDIKEDQEEPLKKRPPSKKIPNLEQSANQELDDVTIDVAAGTAVRRPIPARISLFRIKGIEVLASLMVDEYQPWHLRVNALAIPVGVKGGMYGGLVQALRREIGDTLWQELHNHIQDAAGGGISANEPVLIPLENPELGAALLPNAPDFSDATLLGRVKHNVIAVTVGDVKTVNEIRDAARAIVQQASARNIRWLAVPSLGTGRGQFKDESVLVAENMVQGVYNAIQSLHTGAIAEVTLTTRDVNSLEAMKRRANLLINSLSQRLHNDEPHGSDLLNIQAEVNALAEALLLQDVEPPLSVGILGGWGSGKSFVMHLMQERMIEIRDQASPGWPSNTDGRPDMPFVGHVYQIEFNAWTYAKSNLWASLMQTIFCELNRQLTLEQQLAAKLAFQENQGSQSAGAVGAKQEALLRENSLWKVLYKSGEEELHLLFETEVGKQVVEEWQRGDVPTDELWSRLKEQSREETDALKETQNELVAEQKMLAEEIEKAAGSRNLLSTVRQRPVMSAVFLLTIAAFVLCLWIVPDLVAWRWPGAIASAAASLAAWQKTASAIAKRIRTEYADYLENRPHKPTTGDAVNFSNPTIEAIKERIDDLKVKENEQRQHVGLTEDYISLCDLTQSRLDEDFYQNQLGLMHRVERDLQELTDALLIRPNDRFLNEKRELFPRGPARIVLYIDDLDRCPPKRVIEVLEAVQLLLRTPLFIVVLGLDTRYVIRALEREYSGILTSCGNPSGLDYIEKIVQIPYRVRPLQFDVVPQFLNAQLNIRTSPGVQTSASQTGTAEGTATITKDEHQQMEQTVPESMRVIQKLDLPPDVIAFTQEEYDVIREVCQAVQLTPRSLKRIVNVMKLIKIFWHRAGETMSTDIVKAVVSLLALSARYPEIMRDVFQHVEVRYHMEYNRPNETSPTFNDVFSSFIDEDALRNPHRKQNRNDLVKGIDATLPLGVTLDEMGSRSFSLVRAFSFVGDPMSSVEPLQRVEVINGSHVTQSSVS